MLQLYTCHAQKYRKNMQKFVQKQHKKINLNLELFEQSIKSEYTRNVYIVCLKKYFQFPGSSKFVECDHTTDPRNVEKHIIDYIISLKKEGKGYSGIKNYVSAISKYYKVKDVYLNTNKISQFLPEFKKSKKDRPYRYEEIQKLLEIADERMRVVILLLASTGMRIGAIPDLRLGNIEQVSTESRSELPIHKITGYENTNDEYVTFTTPECSTAIHNYLKMRERYGERLTKDSFLIREQFNIRDPFAISKCKRVKANTLTRKLIDLAERSGIRQKEVLQEGKNSAAIRKDVPICHGFRKFFSSQLVEAEPNVKPELRWKLEGHGLKANDAAYVKTSEKRLQQEYEKGIDNLTIDPNNRLQRTIQTLKVDKSRIDMLEAKIQKLEKRHR
jgi:integrase